MVHQEFIGPAALLTDGICLTFYGVAVIVPDTD